MSNYSIHLSQEQRDTLEQLTRSGAAPARKIMHAQVLLKTDKGEFGPRWSDRQIQEAFEVGESTLKRIRQRFLQEGLQAALERKRQPERPHKRKLDGEQEALLVLLACSEAPHGHERWTMSLLRDRMIELQIVQMVSEETVRMTLKKTNSSHG